MKKLNSPFLVEIPAERGIFLDRLFIYKPPIARSECGEIKTNNNNCYRKDKGLNPFNNGNDNSRHKTCILSS